MIKWSVEDELRALRITLAVILRKHPASKEEKSTAYRLFCEAIGNNSRTERSFLDRVFFKSATTSFEKQKSTAKSSASWSAPFEWWLRRLT